MKKAAVLFCILFSFIMISCQNESEPEEVINVSSISFEKESISIENTQSAACIININPKNAKVEEDKLKYSIMPEDLCEISSTDKSGCVIKGLKKGSGVLTVSYGNIKNYISVEITDNSVTQFPYIKIDSTDIQIEKGKKRTVIANLVGCSSTDVNNFEWKSSDPSVVDVEYSGSTAVLTAKKYGACTINVSNECCLYPASVIAVVPEKDGNIFYLTTKNNVIDLLQNENGKFEVEIIGGNENDYSQLRYRIIDGEENFSISGSGKTCNIVPKKSGTGRIEILHPLSKISLMVTVNILTDSLNDRIICDQDFIYFDSIKSKTISYSLLSGAKGVFSYSLSRENIVDVIDINGKYIITPKTNGNVLMKISNTLVSSEKEVNIVVDDIFNAKDFYSIRTGQNVIKMTEDQENIELEIELLGGNEGDRNNFIWTVSDSSVINVDTFDGTVKYSRSITEEQSVKGKAFIKALKKGHAEIEVSHPKSSNTCIIDVFVYEKGVLNDNYIDVKGDLLVKAETGKESVYNLEGNDIDYEKIECKSSDNSIFNIYIENNQIKYKALQKGNVTVTLSSSQFKNKWSFNVICDTKENLEKNNYIASDVSYIKAYKGKTVYFSINAEFNDAFNIEALSSDLNICETNVISNIVCVTLKNEGETIIRVSCSNFDNILYIPVYCITKDAGLKYPYELEGDSFISLSLEKEYDYNLNISGAPDYEYVNCNYDYNSEQINITGENKKIKIKGLKEGRGSFIISNGKCSENKKVSYIIYKTEDEAKNKNILWCDKESIDGKIGDKILLQINETIKDSSELNVSSNDINKIKVTSEGNFILIELLEEGKCQLKIQKNNSEALYIPINITINENFKIESYFNVPYLVRGIINQKVKIGYEANQNYDNIINWNVPQEMQYTKTKNGIFILAKEKGEYNVNLSCEEMGINKDIKVIIYENEEEYNNDTVIYLDKCNYSISVNEDINLNLKIEGNYDDDFINNLEWKTEENTEDLQLDYNGRSCNIKGKKEGVYKISVLNKKYNKKFEFTVIVYNNDVKNYSNFSFQRIVFVKPGITEIFKYSIEKESLSTADYEKVNVICDDINIDVSCSEDNIAINAREEGDYICTIKRFGINDYKFIVRCSREENPSERFLLCENKTVAVNINEEKTINIYCDEIQLDNIKISVSDDFIDITKNSESITIKGKKEGNGYIKITYYEKEYYIYFSVENKANLSDVSIIVPEILFAKKDQYVDSIVICNKTVFYEYDRNYIELNENGNNFSIKGLMEGLYEVKVFTSQDNYRIIKVFVYSDENQINDTYIINIPQRVYKCLKGQHIFISPFINKSDYENIKMQCDYDSVYVMKDNSKYDLEIKEEGYYKLQFNYHNDSVNIFIYCYESTAEINGEINEDINYYLTSEKTYSFIKLNDADTFKVQIKDFNGNYIFNDNNFIWKTNNKDIIDISYNANICTVAAKKKGRAILYCSNLNCDNIITFTIDTGTDQDLYESIYSFIYVNKTVFDIDINDTVTFEAEFKNIEENKQNTFNIYNNTDICQIDYTIRNNKIYFSVKGIKCGNERIKLSCDGCDFDTDLIFIVQPKTGGKTPFLTTSQNYNVIKPGETVLISVNLENYEEYDMSNYKWEKTSGEDCITLIGNGNEIQVYGKKEGNCGLKVKHIPSKSELNIYITVSSQIKTVKYMTTKSLVIDTGISQILDNINFTMVGGSESDNSGFTYSVDRTDILSIISSNENLYYRGLKEGVAKVHVTNSKSGCVNELDIIFIVSDNKNEALIKADCSSLYLNKNGSSKSVNISFENCSDINEGIIEWFIYSQQSKSGNVVSIVSSGKRCIIQPLNEGYATIRAYYAPLNISASISVYVDQTGKVTFENNNMSIGKNESAFVAMRIPDYIEGICEYISYESLDETVCKAFGTGRVCCIEGIETGSCIVRAVNSFDNSVSEIGITVVDEKVNDAVISLRKNTYLLNPRTEDQKLSAFLTGKDIKDFDEDNIKWEIVSDTTGCLSLYPSVGSDVLLKLNPVNDANDVNYGKVKNGQAVIKVSHEKCLVPKTIYVSIDELDNFFTLEKYSAKINVSQNYSINCDILNSKLSDYDNVKWSISGYNTDKYGNRVEVAKLLNDKGKTCSIFGLNEGVCTLTAFYLGSCASCEITVNADRTFRINGTTSVKMFPDVNEENYADISYIVRPSNQVPVWSIQNVDKPNDVTLLSIEDVPGASKIRLRPNGIEGKCKITGYVVGVGQVSVNVEIKFLPELRLVEEVSDCIIKMDDESDNTVKYRFESYPSMYYVKLTKGGKYAECADIFIEDTKKKGDYLEGTIVIKAKKEFPVNGISVLLEQYRSNDFSESSKVNSQSSRVSFNVSAYYEDSGFSIGFRRGRGGFSFFNESANAASLYNVSDKFINEGENTYYKFYDSTDSSPKAFELGDAEQHYFVLKTKNKNQYMEDLSITIEKDGRRLNINSILANKMSNLSYDQKIDMMDNIDGWSNNSMPAVSNVEKRADGSYIFDISTGEYNNKYGINWYIKEKELNNKKLTKANKYYCSRTNFNIPVFEGLGTLDDISFYGDHFKFNNSNKKYILSYDQSDFYCKDKINANQPTFGDDVQIDELVEGLFIKAGWYLNGHSDKRTYTIPVQVGPSSWEDQEVEFEADYPNFPRWEYMNSYFDIFKNNYISEEKVNELLNLSSVKIHKETASDLVLYESNQTIELIHEGSRDTSEYYYCYYVPNWTKYTDMTLNVYSIIIENKRYALYEYILGKPLPQSINNLGSKFYLLMSLPEPDDSIIRKYDNGNYYDDTNGLYVNDLGLCKLYLLYDTKGFYIAPKKTKEYIDEPDYGFTWWGISTSSIYSERNFVFAENIDKFNETVTDYSINRNFDFSSNEYIEYNYYTDSVLKNNYNINTMSNYPNYTNQTLHIYPSNNGKITEIDELNRKYKNLYDYRNQLQKYCRKAYYNNDTVADFEYDNLYLVIRWKGITGKINEKKIPLKVLFYNNYSDYYSFENGVIQTHPDRINDNIMTIEFE